MIRMGEQLKLKAKQMKAGLGEGKGIVKNAKAATLSAKKAASSGKTKNVFTRRKLCDTPMSSEKDFKPPTKTSCIQWMWMNQNCKGKTLEKGLGANNVFCGKDGNGKKECNCIRERRLFGVT